MQTDSRFLANPLSGIISDREYFILQEHDLLNERGVRDFLMRRKFRHLRRAKVPAFDAIEQLREEYPYLQFDTIRKIVYNAGGRGRED